MYFVCVISDHEHGASSLLVKADICSQKVQVYTALVSGGRRRALWTGTTLAIAAQPAILDDMCLIIFFIYNSHTGKYKLCMDTQIAEANCWCTHKDVKVENNN